MTSVAIGEIQYSEDQLFQHLMESPEANLNNTIVNFDLSAIVNDVMEKTVTLKRPSDGKSIQQIDSENQKEWSMPAYYKSIEIDKFVLSLCTTDKEFERVAEELLLYQEYDLFDLLRYMKFFVDTLKENNIIWGVGRGSSVASYVLYLLGVHKINSLEYDLPIQEFFK